MAAIKETQEEIIDSFSLLDGDLEMSTVYLMELGQKLPDYPEEKRTEDRLVKGCQSKVWLEAEKVDGKVRFHADSNTQITKGLVSLLVRIYNDRTPDEILNSELFFIDKIGMNRFIGTQRSNGLGSMIQQMKNYAIAFS